MLDKAAGRPQCTMRVLDGIAVLQRYHTVVRISYMCHRIQY